VKEKHQKHPSSAKPNGRLMEEKQGKNGIFCEKLNEWGMQSGKGKSVEEIPHSKK
jgi:hypothetical protein